MKRFFSLLVQAVIIAAVGFAALQVVTGGNGGPGFSAGGTPGTGDSPEQKIERNPTLVKPETLQITSVTPEIAALGQVTAWQESTITSETSGRVTWISPKFETGIAMEKGTPLLRVNALAFRRDLLVAQSNLDTAQEALIDAQAETKQARAEFARLNIGEPTDQALKLAELEAAELSVGMAELDVEIAQEALDDTEIRMPYDGTITNRGANVGDQISAGTSLGEVTGTKRFKLVLSVLDSQIGYIKPGQSVVLTPTNGADQREGRVVSIDLKLDPSTLLNSVIVEVPEPLSGTPLRIGAYLRGAIAGSPIADVLAIPLTAISNEGYFYEISDEMTLIRHDANPVFREQSYAYVKYDRPLKIVEQDVLGLRDGQVIAEMSDE